jgi:hypothetical protein
VQRERSNAKQETQSHKKAASELAAVGAMNAGRAFDRDLRGDQLAISNRERLSSEGRSNELQQIGVAVIIGGHDVRHDPIT